MIMNLKILITLYFISFAYSASISGFIRDADTGEPLSYANIIILNRVKMNEPNNK